MKLAERVAFDVIGRPQQKGSKRPFMTPRVGGGVNVHVRDANPNAKPWALAVAAEAALAHRNRELIRGPVAVTLLFYFKRPKGHYGTGRNADRIRESAPWHMTTTPDLDKLARCAIDALSGTVIGDDAQIMELRANKRYGDPERVEITIEEAAT